MPLLEGKSAKTKKGFSKNVRTEIKALKKKNRKVSKKKIVKQAVAIAYNKKRGN